MYVSAKEVTDSQCLHVIAGLSPCAGAGQLEAEKGSVESELRAVQQEEHSQALGHTQLQELASMLQESHRYNDRL